MRRLSVLDAAWLTVESKETPMHVGSLQIYSLPENAPSDYVQKMVDQLRSAKSFAPPWNLQIKPSPLSKAMPAVRERHDVDMEYHVRHSALPRPGGERELGELISRLHARGLDLTRPLWECHLIEGLEGNRIALYTKMHHALVDGVGGVRIMQQALGKSADERVPPPWSRRPMPKKKPRGSSGGAPLAGNLNGWLSELLQSTRGEIKTLPELAKTFGEFVKAARQDDDPLGVPYRAPKSVINSRVTPPRRFATQQYSIERLKKLAAAAEVTLNDVVLGLCGSSLRRFLLESNALPNQALTAGIPVSVRPAGDNSVGTAISFIIATLGTDIADPKLRLETIHESTRRAKENLQKLPRSAIDRYSLMLMGPFILQLITGLGGRTRPVFNVTISNVPGPDYPLFYNGLKMEGIYPVSLLSHGQSLNITCLSYDGNLNFGFTACRDTLPKMQRLSVYTGEALEELEEIYGLRKPAKPRPARRKAATTRKAPAAKPKTAKTKPKAATGKTTTRRRTKA